MKLTADNMKNKKITILGAGLSGVAAANLAINFNAKVFISDLKINSKLQTSLQIFKTRKTKLSFSLKKKFIY